MYASPSSRDGYVSTGVDQQLRLPTRRRKYAVYRTRELLQFGDRKILLAELDVLHLRSSPAGGKSKQFLAIGRFSTGPQSAFGNGATDHTQQSSGVSGFNLLC